MAEKEIRAFGDLRGDNKQDGASDRTRKSRDWPLWPRDQDIWGEVVFYDKLKCDGNGDVVGSTM